MTRYTVSFDVEVTPQDDTTHQPDTVNARLVGTNNIVVGDHPGEAIRMLVQFLAQGFFREHAQAIVEACRVGREG